LPQSALFAVSFGGTVSLFLGCSILSGVELLYYFTLRLVCALWTKYKDERELDSPPEVQKRVKEQTSPAAVLYENNCTNMP
jgi:amiloride-sensitive sodium channel